LPLSKKRTRSHLRQRKWRPCGEGEATNDLSQRDQIVERKNKKSHFEEGGEEDPLASCLGEEEITGVYAFGLQAGKKPCKLKKDDSRGRGPN